MVRLRLQPAWFLFTCLLSIWLHADFALANDWPQWRGPHRDGRIEEPGLELDWTKKPPRHLWTIDGAGSGYGSMAIVNGKLYVVGNRDNAQALTCFDLESHSQVWSTPITEQVPQHDYSGSRCTPTIDEDRAYVVTSDGQIACLGIADGRILWKRNFQEWGGRMMSGWGYAESPLVDDGLVVCTPGGDQAIMVALDKMSGQEVWKARLPGAGQRGKDGAAYSSIVVSEGGGVKQYVQLVGRGVIGVRASDGKFLWGYDKVANDVANIPTPICTGDYVFSSTGYQTGAALLKLSPGPNQTVTAEEVYFLESRIFQNHHGQMILDNGYIYAGHQHGKGFPICIELMTGKVVWGGNIRPVGSGSAAVIEVNHQLIFRYQDGVIALINATPAGYQLKGSFKPEYQEGTSWSHPVVVDGKLYLREQNKLMCYQL